MTYPDKLLHPAGCLKKPDLKELKFTGKWWDFLAYILKN